MKKLYSLLISLLFVSALGQAQNTFSKIYEKTGYESARDVCETMDKGYAIVGIRSDSLMNDDIFVLKTNQFGDTLWSKSFGNKEYDQGFSIKQTTDQGFIIVGITHNTYDSYLNWDLWLIKLNGNGELIWTKTFGETRQDYGVSVETSDDGGFILLGVTDDTGTANGNPFLVRTNSTGDSIWSSALSCGSIGCYATDLCITSDGGYLISGKTLSRFDGESGHVFLIKADSNGEKVWSNIYTNYTDNVGVSIIEAPDGGFIFAGPSNRNLSDGSNICEILLTKIDQSGNIVWTKTPFNGEKGYNFGHSVDNTVDSGFIISGKAYNPKSLNYDVILIKTNSLGDTLWTKFYDSLANGYFDVIVKQTSDEGFIVTGETADMWGHTNAFLLKTDRNGNTSGIANTIATKKENDCRVYPNPVNDILTIQRDDNSKILVELVDVQGRVIYQEASTENPVRIDVKKYDAGTYILKVTSGSKIVTRLVMKAN